MKALERIKWVILGKHTVASSGLYCICHGRSMKRCCNCGVSVFVDLTLGGGGVCPRCLGEEFIVRGESHDGTTAI